MKTRLINFILLAVLFSLVSCQSKNKAASPNEKEVSISDASASNDATIEVIKDESSVNTEDTSGEAIEQQKPTDTQIIEETITKAEEIKTIETKNQDIEKIKEKTIEKVNKPQKPKPSVKVPTTKPANTSTNKVIKATTDPIIKEETKEVVDKEKDKVTTKPEKPIKTNVPVGYPNHKLFDSFLKKYVSNSGTVNYAGIKKNEAELDAYLTTLENTKFNTTWSREDKLAFWINAYNAYTVKLILNNYPVAKITDLHSGKPWDHKWIELNGKTLSLNNIENDIIRPEFKEPRIHFAVNCAAKSCPPLLNAAYTAGNLESKLESQTKKFINNSAFNTLGKSEITISKIFDWYGVDFGNVASYIARYADNTVKPSAKVKFNEYDWSLNEK